MHNQSQAYDTQQSEQNEELNQALAETIRTLPSMRVKCWL